MEQIIEALNSMTEEQLALLLDMVRNELSTGLDKVDK